MSAKPFAVLFSLLVTLVPAAAQDAPPPAAELQPLAPLLGDWRGEGVAHFAPDAPPTPWRAAGTYRWALGGAWLQEDFAITFEGMAVPLTFRGYLGWDAEARRHVAVVCNNAGEVALHELKMLPDGSMVQLMLQEREGVPYAERALLKIDGDTMTHSIDLLMAQGASRVVVEGTFRRGGEPFAADLQAKTFGGRAPHADLTRLLRMAGSYAIEGHVVAAPGGPELAIRGVETFTRVFGDTVLFAEEVGTIEGMPGERRAHAFWAFDHKQGCLHGVFVGSGGEVGAVEGRWVGEAFVSTTAGTIRGAPAVQRYVLEFDAAGAATRAVGHTIAGTAAPFASYVGTFVRR